LPHYPRKVAIRQTVAAAIPTPIAVSRPAAGQKPKSLYTNATGANVVVDSTCLLSTRSSWWSKKATKPRNEDGADEHPGDFFELPVAR